MKNFRDMLRAMAYATIELVSRVSTTVATVMMALFSAAFGKLVSVHASAKLLQLMVVGRPKPVPPSWSGVFKAVTTAK